MLPLHVLQVEPLDSPSGGHLQIPSPSPKNLFGESLVLREPDSTHPQWRIPRAPRGPGLCQGSGASRSGKSVPPAWGPEYHQGHHPSGQLGRSKGPSLGVCVDGDLGAGFRLCEAVRVNRGLRAGLGVWEANSMGPNIFCALQTHETTMSGNEACHTGTGATSSGMPGTSVGG